jgi:hypothetical protein
MKQNDSSNEVENVFTVACCQCGRHFFKFSKNMLLGFASIRLDCSYRMSSTQVELSAGKTSLIVKSYS